MDNDIYFLCHEPDLDDPDAWIRNRIVENIRARGCHITGAYIGDKPPWAYTVGLWESCGVPELAMFGFEHNQAGEFLDSLVAGIREGERMPVDRLRADLPVLMRPLHEDWRALLPMIPLHYGDLTTPVWQVCWADDNGRLPDEEGFDEQYADWQPLAWLPKVDHPASVWLR